MSRSFNALLVTCSVLVAAVVPFALQMLGQGQVYWLFIASELFVFAIISISLDLLMGRAGQISLGHAGFVALGAYTAAILNTHYGTDLLIGSLAGGLVAAAGSIILGFPAARLRGHYLGIVTLGFGIAVDQIALKWDSLTGGGQGIHVKRPTLLGIDVGNPTAMYYVSLGALIIAAFLVWNLTRTRLGRAFAAVKDSEVAAGAMGIPVARTKVIAFLCSAFLAGVSGGIYAFLTGYIAPEDFELNSSLLFFAMTIVGGLGSIRGAIGGAVVVDGIKNAAATVSGLSLTILGGMIVLIALFFPGGMKALLNPTAKSRHERIPLTTPIKKEATTDA